MTDQPTKRHALPYDICRCSATVAPCPYKQDCARYTSNWNPCAWQPRIDASVLLVENKRCAMFISNQHPFEQDNP